MGVDLDDWRNELGVKLSLVGYYLSEVERTDDDDKRAVSLAFAREEVNALAADITTVAADVYSISDAELQTAVELALAKRTAGSSS